MPADRVTPLTPARRARLEAAGFRVGDATDFLALTAADLAVIRAGERLGATLRTERARRGLSQAAVARLVGSSQSRVAKMEGGDPSVSLDLLLRTLVALGTRPTIIGRVIASAVGSAFGSS